MLETIREFAFEKLDESGERAGVLQEHAAFFTQLTETAEPHMTSGRRDVWLARLEEEIDNIRIVMSRSLSDLIDPMFGIRVAGTLGWFWHLHGHVSEAGRWATSMLTLPQAAERSRERAKVLFSAGGSAWLQGNYATANAILEESAALLREIGDPRGLTDARVMLVGGLAGVGEIDRALGICEETLLLLRQADDSWGIAFTLTWYGAIVMVRNGDAVLARSMFEESRTLAKELNDPWLHAEALNHLGFAESWQGNFETAVSYFQESLSYHEATGDRWATARALSGYGETALRRGETEEAKRLFCRSALIWREMGNRPGTLACLFGLAQIAGAEQEWVRSARLFGAAPTPVRVVGYLFLTVAASEYSDCVERVRDALGDELWMKERENGTSMSLEEAVTYAFDDTETEP
jgi:non-specific serine/threonine protein kinase